MSVASVGSSTNLYQLLQQLDGNTSNTSSGATGSASTGWAAALGADPNGPQAQETQPHHHRHGGGQLQNQIESAVTQALQNSNGTTDPNTLIEQAIAGVLKANGSASGTTGTTANGPTAADPVTAAQQQQQFGQLLQANGVDAKAFQADLQAALQQTQGGGVDFSKVFASFPPGSAVDTTA